MRKALLFVSDFCSTFQGCIVAECISLSRLSTNVC